MQLLMTGNCSDSESTIYLERSAGSQCPPIALKECAQALKPLGDSAGKAILPTALCDEHGVDGGTGLVAPVAPPKLLDGLKTAHTNDDKD